MNFSMRFVWKRLSPVSTLAAGGVLCLLSTAQAENRSVFAGEVQEVNADRIVVSDGRSRMVFERDPENSDSPREVRVGEHVKVHYGFKAQSITPVAEDNQRAGRAAPEAVDIIDDRAFYEG